MVALVQSLLSSRHRMIYSCRAILALTIASTCCDACASPPFSRLPPVAADIKPAQIVSSSSRGKLAGTGDMLPVQRRCSLSGLTVWTEWMAGFHGQ